MLSSRHSLAQRILYSRRLRPPNPKTHLPAPLLFIQISQLHLVSKSPPRPELPYLFFPASRFQPASVPTQHQSRQPRYITTSRKERFKTEAKLTLWYILIGNSFVALGMLLIYLIHMEATERTYPTPTEWTFRSRNIYRTAHKLEDPEAWTVLDWPKIGNHYCVVLSRLEDPTLDGKGLPIAPDEDRAYVVGIDALGFSKKGLDISSMSEEWRRGYHIALMKAARASEHLEDMVRDRTRRKTFSREQMIGPSNPRPKPVPMGAASAPLEENCDPVSQPPQVFYMKALTTTGFTSGQRLDAALAYADWLDYKGLHETAEEMYDWGLDIAMGALPIGANNIVDMQTGLINSNATYVSNNVLRATAALAVHHARTDNVSAALPIMLSILRARKQLSLPPVTDPDASAQEPSIMGTIISTVRSTLISPPYPPPPPTGDEVPIRTQKAICEEAALMSHIGEILFASSNADATPSLKPTKPKSASQNQQSGLSWTRDAVDIAETTLSTMSPDDLEGRQTCTECLEVSMDNWSKMVRRILKEQQQQIAETKEDRVGGVRGWFWGGESIQEVERDEGRWERELQLVGERMVGVERVLERERNARRRKGWDNVFGFGG
ncbi:MAG: hypothetical protein Q9174_002550 [Haloplaca sp. 1 TL-2023]